jgi:hypothetical protein
VLAGARALLLGGEQLPDLFDGLRVAVVADRVDARVAGIGHLLVRVVEKLFHISP